MKKALEKFLKIWKDRDFVVGIVLTGSYALEMNNDNSDIDIRLIFSKDSQTIKGLIEIDGYKFSYLGRSYEKIANRIKIEHSSNYKFEATVFSIGKILFEKESNATKIKELANLYKNTNFLIKEKDIDELKTNLYLLYNYKTYLNSIDHESPYFTYVYMLYMKLSLKYYSDFLNYENVSDLKIEKLFTNQLYREKCNWDEFPDLKFVNLWESCIMIKNINKMNVSKIFEYLQEKIINFNEKKMEIYWNN